MLRQFRGFGSQSFLNTAKNSISLAEKLKSIPRLQGTPSIYNNKSSASNVKGYSKAKAAAGLYYAPAPTVTTGSISSETIPKSFFPADDTRREITEMLREADAGVAKVAPPLHIKGEKTYHLTPKDIEEINRLRQSDPDKYTRKVLAKMFEVSPLFISIVSSASPERKKVMEGRLAAIKKQWHPKRQIAREDRKKRKELWCRA